MWFLTFLATFLPKKYQHHSCCNSNSYYTWLFIFCCYKWDIACIKCLLCFAFVVLFSVVLRSFICQIFEFYVCSWLCITVTLFVIAVYWKQCQLIVINSVTLSVVFLTVQYSTIWYGIFTCIHKLTGGRASLI